MSDSEKLIERKLAEGIKKIGGFSFKLLSTHVNGLPDRICLLPGGKCFFAEIKSTGKKPTKLQILMHRKLRKLGFHVEVIDNLRQLQQILIAL